MKKRNILALLCAMLVCFSVFCACNGTEINTVTPDEITASDATQEQTNTQETSEEVATTEQAATEASAEQATQDKNENVQTQSGKPADRVESSKQATINVGGKDYTVNVGDRITYICYLKTPASIENIQASVSYDNTALFYRHTSSKEMFPTLSGVIYNANITGSILFNASEPMEGFDFSNNGMLIKLEFDVAKEGYTSIATAIEFMDELGGKPYIDSFNIVGNITITETLV